MLSFRWFYPDGQHHFSLAEQHFIFTEFQNPHAAVGCQPVFLSPVINKCDAAREMASQEGDVGHRYHEAAFLPVIPAGLAPEIIGREGRAPVLFNIASSSMEIIGIAIDL